MKKNNHAWNKFVISKGKSQKSSAPKQCFRVLENISTKIDFDIFFEEIDILNFQLVVALKNLLMAFDLSKDICLNFALFFLNVSIANLQKKSV